MYEMLQQIVGILTRDFSSTDWSEIIIEDLFVEVHGVQQLCLGSRESGNAQELFFPEEPNRAPP